MPLIGRRKTPAAPPAAAVTRPQPDFAWTLAIALAVTAGAAFLLMRLIDVVLLIFAGALIAVLLHAIAQPLRRHLRFGRMAALTAALLVVTFAIGVLIWAFGSQLETQLAALSRILPEAWRKVAGQLSTSPFGRLLLEEVHTVQRSSGLMISWAPRIATGALSVTGALIVVMFAGAYFAFHPQTYVGGALLLFPRRMRERAQQVLGACQLALTRWLVGQLLSMILVGVTTGVGLWMVGVPSPIPLALMEGLGQFVPVIGPWLGAAPGLIVGYSMGQETFLWTVLVYFVTTQFEANFFTPYVLRRMADVPMAITLFAVIGLGMLLGPLGVLLATPLSVVGYVLVREVYVKGMLGEHLANGDPPPAP